METKKWTNLPKVTVSTGSAFFGGAFLNDEKSKRQVIFSYLHYGGLIG